MSTPCWPQIEALWGRIVHTVARHQAFTVLAVTHGQVELVVHDGGRTRIFFRKDLEPFYDRLVHKGVLTIAELKTVYKFNSSLAATPQPITLRYKP